MLVLASSLTVATAPPALAEGAIIMVNTFLDDFTDEDVCTLREAITAAELDQDIGGCDAEGYGDDDTIQLLDGTYFLVEPLPAIGGKLRIEGDPQGDTVIDGLASTRLFEIAETGDVTLQNLTITGGSVGPGCDDDPCVPFPQSPCNSLCDGAGILNRGRLTLTDVTVRDNSVTCREQPACEARGGGIFIAANAQMDATRVTITGNVAECALPTEGGSCPAMGGGIFVAGGGQLSIEDSLIGGESPNKASCSVPPEPMADETCLARGGGIFLERPAELQLTNSTVSGNVAERVGGPCSSVQFCDAYGGGMAVDEASFTGSRNVISGNRASCHGAGCSALGGGMLVHSPSHFSLDETTVDGNLTTCDVNPCVAGAGGLGFSAGPDLSDDHEVTISRSTLSSNEASCEAEQCFAFGGGIAGRGKFRISNTTVSGNDASCTGMECTADGGGLEMGDVTTMLIATTITNNRATCEGNSCLAHAGIGDAQGANETTEPPWV